MSYQGYYYWIFTTLWLCNFEPLWSNCERVDDVAMISIELFLTKLDLLSDVVDEPEL